MRTLEGTVVDVAPVRNESEQNVNDDHADDVAVETEPTQRIDVQVSSLEEATEDADRQLPVAGRVRLTVR